MERLTPQQRLQIVELNFQNQCSIRQTYGALREIYGLLNPSSLLDTTTRQRSVRTEENIAAVGYSVDEDPDLSIRRRSQQVGICASTTWNFA